MNQNVDYFQSYGKQKLNSGQTPPVDVLESFAMQIHQKFYTQGLTAIVVQKPSSDNSHINYIVKLIPILAQNYEYNFIEAEQVVDNVNLYPVNITSFQNEPLSPRKINTSEELTKYLQDVMGMSRTQLVFNHLMTMGKIISEGKKDISDAFKERLENENL